MTEIKIDELKKMMKDGEDFQLVDVRGKECCYDLEHIPGALNIPLNVLEERIAELDNKKPTIVYCGGYSCSLSPRAEHMMKEHFGFGDIRDYSGGIKEWINEGNKVEK